MDGWGSYGWTIVATGVMMSSCPSLLGCTIARGMETLASSWLLYFPYFNELVKLYKCDQMEKHYILSLKLT
jgi:hypothetical protein